MSDSQQSCYNINESRFWNFPSPFPTKCQPGCGQMYNSTIYAITKSNFTIQTQTWIFPQLMYGVKYHVPGFVFILEYVSSAWQMCIYPTDEYVLFNQEKCQKIGIYNRKDYICIPYQNFSMCTATCNSDTSKICIVIASNDTKTGQWGCTIWHDYKIADQIYLNFLGPWPNSREIQCGGVVGQTNYTWGTTKSSLNSSSYNFTLVGPKKNVSNDFRTQCKSLECYDQTLTDQWCGNTKTNQFLNSVKNICNTTKFSNLTRTIMCHLPNDTVCGDDGNKCFCVAPLTNRAMSIQSPFSTLMFGLTTISKFMTNVFANTTPNARIGGVACNSSDNKTNCFLFNVSCNMICIGRQCGFNHECGFWCDGKVNKSGMCNHLCWKDAKNYVHCIDLDWGPFDRVMYWFEQLEIYEMAMLILTIFGLLFWLWYYKWWKILIWLWKTIACCQPRGSLFKRRVRRGWRTRFEMGGVQFATRNCFLMFLLCFFTLGFLRPTRGIVIGPSDLGRTFSNGSLLLTVQRAYHWHNLTEHHDEACLEYDKQVFLSLKCTHHSYNMNFCDVPGMDENCKYKQENGVCARSVIHGGGWADKCFYFWHNPLGGSCKITCKSGKKIRRYFLGEATNENFQIMLSLQGNNTMFWFNRTGTHQVKLANHTLDLTISGCTHQIVSQIGFLEKDATPPIKVGGCAHFKDGFLMDGCELNTWFGYGTVHGECHGPSHCVLDFHTIPGKRTHHAWEHYLTCDYQFQWKEGKCEPDSQGTIIGCVDGHTCLVQFQNCTKCCFKDKTVIPQKTYLFECNNCTWNNKHYNGSQLTYYGSEYDGGILRVKSTAGDLWDLVNSLWSFFTGWLQGLGWTQYLIICVIILCGLFLFYCFCKK